MNVFVGDLRLLGKKKIIIEYGYMGGFKYYVFKFVYFFFL